MKISKRILSAITSAACVLTACIGAVSFSASAATETLGDLEFELSNGQVTITGCNPTSNTIAVPAKITKYDAPVTAIAAGAFENCSNVAVITLPDSIVSIGSDAFSGCTSLQSINIPDSVSSIGDGAFYNTDVLETAEDYVQYVDKWLVGYSYHATSIKIKDNIVGIADYALESCGLESITFIPETLKYIGEYAFYGNSALRTFKIPNKVKTIGKSAFAKCTSLGTVTIGSSVEDIADSAFEGCTSLSGIKIPSSVKHIGRNAFRDTVDFGKVAKDEHSIYIDSWLVYCLDTENFALTVQKGTIGIADYAFVGITHVGSATLPSGVKYIGESAFAGCTSLSQLTIPDTAETIGAYAFANTIIPDVIIPASVKSIGKGAFSGCSNLTEISIISNDCYIDPSANTIPSNARMHVKNGSTAYNYATSFNPVRNFDYNLPATVTEVDGDVNGNGKADLYDAIIICNIMINNDVEEEYRKRADVDGNGVIDLYDAIYVAECMAGVPHKNQK